jgi:PAS domain S-box-containing protein
MAESKLKALNLSLSRYVFAAAGSVVAFFVRELVQLHSGHQLPPYVTFYPAVILAALYAGFGPALLATAISAVLAGYWILEPIGQWAIADPGDALGLALFVCMGVVVGLAAERHRRAQRRLAEYEKQLALQKSEEALRENEAVLQTVTDHARVGLVMLDRNRRYVFANQAYCEVLGLPTTDIVGQRAPDVMAHVYDQIGPRLDRAFAGERVNHELAIPGLPGAADRFYAVTYEPRRDSGGVIGVIVVVVDLTERKRAEDELKTAKQHAEDTAIQVRSIIENMAERLYVCDSKGNLILMNEAFRRTYPGVPAPKFPESFAEYWEAFDLAGNPVPVEDWPIGLALRGQKVRNAEFRTRSKRTGEEMISSYNAAPVFDAQGKLVMALFTTQDISARKQAEAALRASEERWATTLRSIGDAVISTCALGKIIFMNDVAQKLTGWTLEEAEGKDLSTVFNIVQEVTRIKPEDPVSKVIRLGKVVGLANHTALINRDGTEIPIEDSGAPIRNHKGEIEGVVLVFHDVSEQRKMEQAVRTSDRLATTGRLAATIAHEIHNPLDAVGNLLYLVQQNTKDEQIRQFASLASEELSRVTQMTQQMLTFQRESAKPVPVQIEEIFDNVVALYQRKIESGAIQIEKQIEVPHPLLAQPGELRQVVANLLGNAIEAVGRDHGRIWLRAHVARDWRRGRSGVRVIIADNGRGIPAGLREKIFDPFFTTKGESGTGLGLWITSDIIRKYDGTIRLRSATRAGRSGTCFSIFLPNSAVVND